MPREVTWPLLLRPPVLRLPSVSALTGLPFQSDDLSTRIRPRREGLVGLCVLSAIVPASDTGRDVDRVLPVSQSHDRLLYIGTLIRTTLPALAFAFLVKRIHARHLAA